MFVNTSIFYTVIIGKDGQRKSERKYQYSVNQSFASRCDETVLYQRGPTAANIERPLDTEPNKVKVTKNEDTLIQESETSAEQVKVNQGREFKELQQQLRLLEGDLAAMRNTLENEENKPEIFRLQLEQMEMKTKIKHKKLELRIRNEFKEVLHNINQIKIAESGKLQ